jgi:hypothetical protein
MHRWRKDIATAVLQPFNHEVEKWLLLGAADSPLRVLEALHVGTTDDLYEHTVSHIGGSGALLHRR